MAERMKSNSDVLFSEYTLSKRWKPMAVICRRDSEDSYMAIQTGNKQAFTGT